VFIGVYPWLKTSFLPNEPKLKNSETLANQSETQKPRVILAQKRTQISRVARPTIFQSVSKGFKPFQSNSKVVRKKIIFPSIPFSASIYL
jgi:hypothetical protein